MLNGDDFNKNREEEEEARGVIELSSAAAISSIISECLKEVKLKACQFNFQRKCLQRRLLVLNKQ